MELGISLFGDMHINLENKTIQSAESRLKELKEEIILADEVGLDILGIGEHHREEYAVSSPEIALAFAASITKKIKLTSAVSVLSSSDPVKLFQDFTLLQALSDGRAELMAGRGSFIESFPLFGHNLQDYNELFIEKLDLLFKLNQEELITWKGKFRPALEAQQIFPRAEKPLDIWVASGGSQNSVMNAAQDGIPLIMAVIAGTPLTSFAPLYKLYKSIYNACNYDQDKYKIGMFSHGIIGNDSKKIKEYYFNHYASQMNRIADSRGRNHFQKFQYDFGTSPAGAMFVGDPSEITDKILYARELYGITRFILHLDVGAPSHKHIMKSIELFGEIVAPAVRKAITTQNH